LTCVVRDVNPFWENERVEIERCRWLADDGDFIKAVLTRLTGRSTFPNVILHGESIGGSDDITAMHKDGRLRQLFENAGLTVRAELRDEEA
jgi:glutaredoxin